MQGNLVTASAKELRALSRWSLKDCWGAAILASLLCDLVVEVPAIFFELLLGQENWFNISNVYSLLVTAPLSLGMTMFYLNIFRKRQTSPVEIFYGFEFILKAVLLQIIMGVLIFLQACLFIIPGIIAAYRYSLAFFVLADDPKKSAMQCIRESKYLMMGNKMSIFVLSLTFFGWCLLAAIPMSLTMQFFPKGDPLLFNIAFFLSGLGLCIVRPYMQVAYAAFYEMASGRLQVKRTETYTGSGYAQGFDTTQNMGSQAPYQGQPQGEPQAQPQSQPQLWPQGEQQVQPQSEPQNDAPNDGDKFQN